jgi:hypothetical protein
MKENLSLNGLTNEPESKIRFNIKKIAILALKAFIIYYIIGIIAKRLFWKPDTDCTLIENKKPAIICSNKCGQESLACRQSCSKEDQGCYKECYANIYLLCYETCYGHTTSQIKKCEAN